MLFMRLPVRHTFRYLPVELSTEENYRREFTKLISYHDGADERLCGAGELL